jgi:hypothetical protein
MGDIVMLVAGAALVVVGMGMGRRRHTYDWLDSGRQKMIEDWGLPTDYRSVSASFPLNALKYEIVENPSRWSVAPERSRRNFILNAADTDEMNEAAAFDIAINNRRRNTKKYGVRYTFM